MLIVDIDLSILGSPRSRFIEYEKQIREEYSRVPNEIFNERRRALLMKFLFNKHIYNTPYFQNNYEDKARDNLAYSIKNILS
jgi:predicted metal-dependent HD superfamily phosphohydrolase